MNKTDSHSTVKIITTFLFVIEQGIVSIYAIAKMQGVQNYLVKIYFSFSGPSLLYRDLIGYFPKASFFRT